LIEMTVTANEKVSGGVVLGEGVAPGRHRPTFVDVTVGIDQVVVGDVRPPALLVVILI